MLKCQFHVHTKGDLEDLISYTPEQLIDRATELKYAVLSITCHRIVIFDKKLREYAKKKGILLIPGVEFEIDSRHILGINVDKDIENVNNFKKLKKYRSSHPECLIIATHPFFPTKKSLKEEFTKNIEFFDAVENSFAYTKIINFNKKTLKLAQAHSKPVIATADCHILRYLNIGYTLIEAERNISAIIAAIKKNKIKNITEPTSHINIFLFFLQTILQNFIGKLKK